jgi:CspA family cold shock protein
LTEREAPAHRYVQICPVCRHSSDGWRLLGVFRNVVTGTVKSFNRKKRFGFIRPDSGGEDIFVHSSEVQRGKLSSLRKGQRVTFSIVYDQGRAFAHDLQICGKNIQADKRVVSDQKHGLKLAPIGLKNAMNRHPITSNALESVVTKAVKDSDALCETFVGIIVERIDPKSNGGINWTLKGVKYGKADRAKCDIAIREIVDQLQQEFIISDEPK